MRHWILKTEPSSYSIADLKRDDKTIWDGVRNYQARNNLKSMKVGDLAMIYHSVGPREIVGIARVTKEAFDEATNDKGDWVAVEVKFLEELAQTISLQTLKQDESLKDLSLIKQSRLSVCPVTKEQWLKILRHARP